MRHEHNKAKPQFGSLAKILLVSVALVAAACGTSASSSTTSKPPTSSSKGGTLTVGASIAPASLSPLLSQNAQSQEWYDDLAYEPFIVHGPQGQLEPGLATSWGYVGSGNTTFEMTLRPKVKFSDGTTLTAAVAKANIEAEIKNPGKGAYLGDITSVQVVGPLKVEMKLSAANAGLPVTFSQSTNPGWVISPKGLANLKALGSTTAGAGPYKLDAAETVPNSSYVYVPNPYYYDPSAIHWKEIIIKVISNQASALAALETGEVQVIQGSIDQVSAAKAAGLNVTVEPGSYGSVTISDTDTTGKKPPAALGSQLVREALNYAIDRKAIMNALFGKDWAVDDEGQAPGQQGYDAGLANYYNYNVAKAKTLMAQAGYPKGGFTVQVTCAPQPFMAQVCEAVKADWAVIGVTLNVAAPSQDGWVSDIDSGTYQFVADIYSEAIDPSTIGYFLPGPLNDNTVIPGLQTAFAAANSAPTGSAQATTDFNQLQKIELTWGYGTVIGAADLIMFSSKSVGGIDWSAALGAPYPLLWYHVS